MYYDSYKMIIVTAKKRYQTVLTAGALCVSAAEIECDNVVLLLRET